MRLLIVGSTTKTAGIGGVAIHVERLLESLKNENVKLLHVDYKESMFRPFAKAMKADVVHIHTQNKVYSFLLTMWSKVCGARVVYTLHQKYEISRSLPWMFCNGMFRMADCVVVLNSQSQQDIKRRLGIDTVLMPAFIPPTHVEELDAEVENALKAARAEGKRIFVTNAAYYCVTDGKETYGITFLVEQFEKKEDCLLVIADPRGQNKVHIGRSVPNVIFVDKPISYCALLGEADASIRNTSTDGDALSVKESISMGVPTLCTNVVDRPEQAILFNYSDEVSFEKALEKSKCYQSVCNGFDNPVLTLLDVYRGLS